MSEIDWASLLAEEDVEGLWNGLYQLISRHPAVRPLHFITDGAAVATQVEINADLAQELFLELFQKQRFDHYISNSYTSAEIENEIAHIEVSNLVGARLRKRYPESFRLARRVSALLKTSARFRCLSGGVGACKQDDEKPAKRRGRPPKHKAQPGNESKAALNYNPDSDIDACDDLLEDEAGVSKKNESRPRRMVNQVYGLKVWPAAKPLRDSGHFTDSIKDVPMRRRDTKCVGRSGSSQLIISNPDLELLIVEILTAIDSPADVRTIRQLTLSKIPLQDYNVASLDEQMSVGAQGSAIKREATDMRETPEAALLRIEQDERVARLADEFLISLRSAVNNNERRYNRLISTLWHCFYNSREPSQLEIASLLGVSDSLISDNRRLIEHELKKLRLSREDGHVFSESLQRLIAAAQA